MYSQQNSLFTPTDHEILKRAMLMLDWESRFIIEMRFWEFNTIEDIARLMSMTWDEVDQSLKTSFNKIKDYCVNHHEFSRNSLNLKLAA